MAEIDPPHRIAPPAWQMPSGVNRGLWDYIHSEQVATGYDASLTGSSLFTHDIAFVEKHCPSPGRLLDLGCGSGRLLVAMARRGHRVLGVDLSQPMLQVAAEKAQTAGLEVDLLRANIVELECVGEGYFDHAACLFSTLGMIVGGDARVQMLRHVFRVLRPGGRFLLHVHNRWWNLRTSQGRKWLLRDWLPWWRDGPEKGDLLMPTHQGVAGLTLHLFTRSQAIRILKGVGFQIVETLPVSIRPDGRLPVPWLLGRLRAYGYLLAAEKPQTD